MGRDDLVGIPQVSRKRRGPKPTGGPQSVSQQVKGVTEVTPADRLADLFSLMTEEVHRRDRAIARLDAAVIEARSLGASWSQIARAAEMTPQGVHAR